jgi:peptidoglycan-associated lipoprotein
MVAALGVTCTLCATARAQERRPSYLEQRLPVPNDAAEVKLGTGFTQGFGNLAPGRGIDRVAGPGIAVTANIDYRFNPTWSLGVESQFQSFEEAENNSSRGLFANLGPTYHFQPLFRGSPWLRLATGYRLLWENTPSGIQGLSVLRHGLQPIAAKVGYDIRVSRDLAFAPVIGSDVNVFLFEGRAGRATPAMSSGQVATFLYAGLEGRFTIGGTYYDFQTIGRQVGRPQAWEPIGVTAPQPESPSAPPVEETTSVSPSVAVSADVLRDCTLSVSSVDKAPKFEVAKSELSPEDMAVLAQIGDCFASGPLRGDKLHLVGRADPRGSIEYNEALGMRRANEVADFLERRGVAADKIEKTSLGKRAARGHDEESWRVDRRVDILMLRP